MISRYHLIEILWDTRCRRKNGILIVMDFENAKYVSKDALSYVSPYSLSIEVQFVFRICRETLLDASWSRNPSFQIDVRKSSASFCSVQLTQQYFMSKKDKNLWLLLVTYLYFISNVSFLYFLCRESKMYWIRFYHKEVIETVIIFTIDRVNRWSFL